MWVESFRDIAKSEGVKSSAISDYLDEDSGVALVLCGKPTVRAN
jgi:hypothetical protein